MRKILLQSFPSVSEVTWYIPSRENGGCPAGALYHSYTHWRRELREAKLLVTNASTSAEAAISSNTSTVHVSELETIDLVDEQD